MSKVREAEAPGTPPAGPAGPAARDAAARDAAARDAKPDAGARDAATTGARAAHLSGRTRSGQALRVAIYLIALVVGVAALHFGRPILMPVLVAMLLALLLSPAVALLERIGLGRSLSSLLVVAGTVVGITAVVVNLAAPAQQWLDSGPERLEQLREKVRLLRAPVDRVSAATERMAEITSNGTASARQVVVERSWTSVLFGNVQAIAIYALIVVILSYFLLSSGDLFLRKLIRVVPTLGDKIRAIEISRTIQHQIGRYYAAITAINTGLGIVVWIAMAALGMPTPALLGAIAGLLNFVPYLGSLVTLAIVSIVSVLTFEAPAAMALPPAVYLLCTVLEGQVIQPIVLGRHFSTAPVIIFVWVLAWGWLWGVGGVLIAVPLLVAAKICAEHLPSWKPLAELLGRD